MYFNVCIFAFSRLKTWQYIIAICKSLVNFVNFFFCKWTRFFPIVRTDRKRVLRIDSIDDYRIIYIFYAVRIFCKIISHRLIRFSQKHKQLLMHNDKMLPNKWFLINTIKNKVGVNWISTKYDKKSITVIYSCIFSRLNNLCEI